MPRPLSNHPWDNPLDDWTEVSPLPRPLYNHPQDYPLDDWTEVSASTQPLSNPPWECCPKCLDLCPILLWSVGPMHYDFSLYMSIELGIGVGREAIM